MTLPIESFAQDFDPKFKVFHELMARKVRDILLVSAPPTTPGSWRRTAGCPSASSTSTAVST